VRESFVSTIDIRGHCVALTLIGLILFSVRLEAAPAQKYHTYVGKVVSIYKGTLSVKGDKGEIRYFAIGKETTYAPNRQPRVGEQVEVRYFFRKGYYVAQQVKLLAVKK